MAQGQKRAKQAENEQVCRDPLNTILHSRSVNCWAVVVHGLASRRIAGCSPRIGVAGLRLLARKAAIASGVVAAVDDRITAQELPYGHAVRPLAPLGLRVPPRLLGGRCMKYSHGLT